MHAHEEGEDMQHRKKKKRGKQGKVEEEEEEEEEQMLDAILSQLVIFPPVTLSPMTSTIIIAPIIFFPVRRRAVQALYAHGTSKFQVGNVKFLVTAPLFSF